SGYVRAANRERLAFSIVANNVPSTWRAKRVEDAIGARLARFDRPAVRASVGAIGPAVPAEPEPVTHVEDAEPEAPEEDVARPAYHEVARGETMDAIAKRYGITVAALRAANGGVDPRRMQPGDRLVLPAPD